MSRFNIVKKCLDAMSADQQDQIIESCVTIVTNVTGRAVPSSNLTRKAPKVKATSKKTTTGKKRKSTALTVGGEEYKSLGKFCEKHDLKKSAIYNKMKKIKTPKAKIKFLEASIAGE